MNELDRIFAQYSRPVDPRVGMAQNPALIAPKKQPKGNQLLKTILSIGGGTLGAIGGTFVAPGAGTAAGGALGSGLGTALGRLIGGESLLGEGGLGEIALDTALGGAFSGAGKALKAAKAGVPALTMAGKEVGRQAAKGVVEDAGVAAGRQALQTAGQTGRKGIASTVERATRQSIIAPGEKSIFRTAPQQAAATNWARRYGLSGSAATNFENINPIIKNLSNEVDEVLKPLTKTVSTSTLRKEISTISGKLSKDQRVIFDEAISEVLKGTANKKALTGLEVNGILRNVNKSFSGIFGKAAKGQQLTAAQQGAERVRKVLKQTIDDLGGEAIKPINKDLAIGLQIQEELFKTKATPNLRLPIFGTPVPLSTATIQKGASIVNRAAGNRLDGAVTGLTPTQALGRQTLAQTLGGFAQPQQPQQPEQEMQDITGGMGDMTDMGAGMGADMGAEQAAADEQAQIDQYFQGLALQDLQQTGGKRLSAIKNAYDLFGGGKASKPSAAEVKAQQQLSGVQTGVDRIARLYSQTGAQGRIGGLVGEAGAALGLNEAAQNYNNQREALLAPLARAISGEVGVLTDRDIKRADRLLPKLTDNPNEARAKLQELYLTIGQRQNINRQVFSRGVTGGSSLGDVLYNFPE
jgi:hypothetical protein